MSFLSGTNYTLIAAPSEVAQPFSVDQYGEVAFTQSQNDSIRWHLFSLLLTTPGERVMRPSYGVGIFGFVFENDDPITVAMLQGEINNQVGLYEPGVSLQASVVAQDANNPSQANVSVTYVNKATRQKYQAKILSNGQVVETQ